MTKFALVEWPQAGGNQWLVEVSPRDGSYSPVFPIDGEGGINPRAVPDLLNALKQLADWVSNLATEEQLAKRGGRLACSNASDAIAKATWRRTYPTLAGEA